MYPMYLKRTIPCGVMVFFSFLLLTACTASNSNSTPTQPPLVQGTSVASTPGVGPTVILTPTRVPGGDLHSQIVTLSDRMLTISSVSKLPESDSGLVTISLAMTIKNTSAKPIKNEADYFELDSAEGDAFGMQSSADTNFFGTIASQSSRSGTINFQVPAGAANGIRLLYRPGVTTEAVSVPLNLS